MMEASERSTTEGVQSPSATPFLRDERGVTAIEYALIGGFLTICLVASIPSVTTALSGLFTSIGGFFP